MHCGTRKCLCEATIWRLRVTVSRRINPSTDFSLSSDGSLLLPRPHHFLPGFTIIPNDEYFKSVQPLTADKWKTESKGRPGVNECNYGKRKLPNQASSWLSQFLRQAPRIIKHP